MRIAALLLMFVLSVVFMANFVYAATDILFQEDWEAENFDQWTMLRVESGGGNLTDDVGVREISTLRRGCPGDFSGCGADERNDYVRMMDDAGIFATVDATDCGKDAELSYWKRTTNLEGNDRLEVEWKLTDSDVYTALESVTNTEWSKSTFVLEGSAGNILQIRFWLNDGASDNGLVDDIQMVCEASTAREVPEFTETKAIIALLGSIIFIFLKYKKNKI